MYKGVCVCVCVEYEYEWGQLYIGMSPSRVVHISFLKRNIWYGYGPESLAEPNTSEDTKSTRNDEIGISEDVTATRST